MISFDIFTGSLSSITNSSISIGTLSDFSTELHFIPSSRRNNQSSSSSNISASSESIASTDNSLNLTNESVDEDFVMNNANDSSGESHSNINSTPESSPSTYDTAGSSDTEAYDVDGEIRRINQDSEIIEINDTQMPNNNRNRNIDEDVVLIPENIETIDLCSTQAAPIPRNLTNEIIDITDSPIEPSRAGPIRNRRRSTRSSGEHPQLSKASKRLELDESLNNSQPRVHLTCPICLDTVVNRSPVSTICGHIFCKNCITISLRTNAKKCPMCKKALAGKKPFFDIFLPC